MVTEVTSATVAVMTPRPAAPSRPDGAPSGADAGGTTGTGRTGSTGAAAPAQASQANANQTAQQQKGSQKALEDAVRKLNDRMQSVQREIHFNIDKDTGETVVKVIDSQSHEVIRQIPSEEMLQLAQHLMDVEKHASKQETPGLILQTKA